MCDDAIGGWVEPLSLVRYVVMLGGKDERLKSVQFVCKWDGGCRSPFLRQRHCKARAKMKQMHERAQGLRWKVELLHCSKWAICNAVMAARLILWLMEPSVLGSFVPLAWTLAAAVPSCLSYSYLWRPAMCCDTALQCSTLVHGAPHPGQNIMVLSVCICLMVLSVCNTLPSCTVRNTLPTCTVRM